MTAELDEKVLEAVRSGRKRFSEIAYAVCLPISSRLVDRALQRLRKAGKIKYVSQREGWIAT
jgi:DNA-binding HxlR family transcriptional regulator